jgi:hypothetical protein
MEHLKSREVAGRVNQRQFSKELFPLTIPEADILIWMHHPLAACFMQVDRRIVERVAPIKHRSVVMGMGDGDGGKTAQGLHTVDGLVVKKTDTVPEDISFGRLNDIRPLTDGEFWLGDNGRDARFVFFKFVSMFSDHLSKTRPLLPLPSHELSRILADRAMLHGTIESRSAGDANSIHDLAPELILTRLATPMLTNASPAGVLIY